MMYKYVYIYIGNGNRNVSGNNDHSSPFQGGRTVRSL